jgi:hypothetical protein
MFLLVRQTLGVGLYKAAASGGRGFVYRADIRQLTDDYLPSRDWESGRFLLTARGRVLGFSLDYPSVMPGWASGRRSVIAAWAL